MQTTRSVYPGREEKGESIGRRATDLRPQQAPRDQGVWSPPAAVTLESPLEDEVRARVRAQTEAVRSKAEAEAARQEAEAARQETVRVRAEAEAEVARYKAEAEAARQETARVRAQALAEAQARKAACSGGALS